MLRCLCVLVCCVACVTVCAHDQRWRKANPIRYRLLLAIRYFFMRLVIFLCFIANVYVIKVSISPRPLPLSC
jgi:hypothetical protein